MQRIKDWKATDYVILISEKLFVTIQGSVNAISVGRLFLPYPNRLKLAQINRFSRSSCKITLKNTIICSFKELAIAIKFIIAVTLPNSWVDGVWLLPSNHAFVRTNIKKLQRYKGFNIIYIFHIPLRIMNTLMIIFCSMYYAKEWGKWDTTIHIWCFDVRIAELKIFSYCFNLRSSFV